VTEGMGGTGQDMGWDGRRKERDRRKGRKREERGSSPLKVQFLAPPLQALGLGLSVASILFGTRAWTRKLCDGSTLVIA